ncbi:LEAF RUST 10 DISEASE-RESISTANCE LOCUS RECEPTOR-LIKE PROTEIN KINASE-like 1.3 [Eucalyptus grandis]|uniref:LEAF RUST 10 DISEASE-RESISTANCE LOCUS RECEPTOR-LIKE PROTEIN KINASE-like 1.3 n=1 Tax=Eucalyptus grandis TaxID=71139 RepID=UPI00192EF1F3|nr:LEAF RUST 10 DISEASE-RESISTANCE LOCUS RECEPTOR-LIKE PROTEIN KINASE-like 1.3 [Eucalyptus grandis]
MDLTMSYTSLSLLFIFSLHIHFLVPASSYFKPFRECVPYRCGDQEISYPFRHNERPSYCGHPGYELDCDGGNLTLLSMASLEYQVIHVDRSEHILKVARTDLLKDICLAAHVNTTLNFSLFNYTSDYLNSVLFYNCNSLSTHLPYWFSCPTSGDGCFAFDADRKIHLYEVCNFSVFVPILPTERLGLPISKVHNNATINRSIIRKILKKGFEITWLANTSLCENCTKSEGRCGYDWTRQEFNCFCPDAAYPATCHITPIPASVPSIPPVPAIVPSSMYAYSHLTCGFHLAISCSKRRIAGHVLPSNEVQSSSL